MSTSCRMCIPPAGSSGTRSSIGLRPVLGGLINEYERTAWMPRSGLVVYFWNPAGQVARRRLAPARPGRHRPGPGPPAGSSPRGRTRVLVLHAGRASALLKNPVSSDDQHPVPVTEIFAHIATQVSTDLPGIPPRPSAAAASGPACDPRPPPPNWHPFLRSRGASSPIRHNRARRRGSTRPNRLATLADSASRPRHPRAQALVRHITQHRTEL